MGRVTLTVIAAVLTATGCTTTTPGAAEPTKLDDKSLFKPCTIPDDTLRAAGLDPATKDADVFGVKRTGWEVCAWKGATWYYVGVSATVHTLDEVKTNTRNTGFQPVSLPGRPDAVSYWESQLGPDEMCAVSYATSRGTITIDVDRSGGLPGDDQPCAVVLRAAVSLNDAIPT